jgi:hypothetical protein
VSARRNAGNIGAIDGTTSPAPALNPAGAMPRPAVH